MAKTSLLDLAGLRPTIEVQGVKIEIVGISADAIVAIMQRFSDVGKLLSTTTPGRLDRAQLIKIAPQAVAAVIAAGTGHPGDEAHEAAAAALGAGVQIEFIDEILKQTFPRGVSSFMEKLQELGVMVEVAKASAALSPTQSKPSSEPDTTPKP